MIIRVVVCILLLTACVVSVSSIHRRRGVERRKVLPAGGTMAHSRQIPTCGTFRLQQDPVVGLSFLLGQPPLMTRQTQHTDRHLQSAAGPFPSRNSSAATFVFFPLREKGGGLIQHSYLSL